MFYVIRAMDFFKLSAEMGPKVIMIFEMIKDLFFFIMILMLFVLAYSIGAQVRFNNNVSIHLLSFAFICSSNYFIASNRWLTKLVTSQSAILNHSFAVNTKAEQGTSSNKQRLFVSPYNLPSLPDGNGRVRDWRVCWRLYDRLVILRCYSALLVWKCLYVKFLQIALSRLWSDLKGREYTKLNFNRNANIKWQKIQNGKNCDRKAQIYHLPCILTILSEQLNTFLEWDNFDRSWQF